MDERVSSPREVVNYLLSLRPIMQATTEARRTWVRDVGLLIEEARTGDPITLSRKAGQLGRAQMPAFREARLDVSHLVPPTPCSELQEAALTWLEKHIEACETLGRAEQQRSLRILREVQEQLGEARRSSQRFNEEYTRLVADLRQRIEAALGAKRGRGRRGRQRGAGIWSLFKGPPAR